MPIDTLKHSRKSQETSARWFPSKPQFAGNYLAFSYDRPWSNYTRQKFWFWVDGDLNSLHQHLFMTSFTSEKVLCKLIAYAYVRLTPTNPSFYRSWFLTFKVQKLCWLDNPENTHRFQLMVSPFGQQASAQCNYYYNDLLCARYTLPKRV